jgi:probable addiction module antidote protein
MRSFDEYNIEKLKDPEDACLYLTEALLDFETDRDVHAFLQALKDVTDAQGGIGELAKRTNLNRQNLYKLLSAKRQPKIETLGAILDGLGFQLTVVPKTMVVSAEHH